MQTPLSKLVWYPAMDFSGEAVAVCNVTGIHYVDTPNAAYYEVNLPNGKIRRVPILHSKVYADRLAACEEHRKQREVEAGS